MEDRQAKDRDGENAVITSTATRLPVQSQDIGEGRENHNRLPVARNIVWGLIIPSIRPRRRVLGGELCAPATVITTEFQLILEHILGGCATNEIHDGLRWEVQRSEGMH